MKREREGDSKQALAFFQTNVQMRKTQQKAYLGRHENINNFWREVIYAEIN